MKEVVHNISGESETSTAAVTSDVTNTFATGSAALWDLLLDATGEMGHGEAKNLKLSGVDPKITRLAWDPT